MLRFMGGRQIAAAMVTGFVLILGGWLAAQSPSSSPDLAAAAKEFLGSLNAEQQARAAMPFETPRRVQWHYVPLEDRKGLPISQLNDGQKQLAHAMLRAVLSQTGYEKTTAIMELEKILRHLEKDRPDWFRDPTRYFFAIFGEPGGDAPWQLSVEGHHVSLNFVVERGRIVSHTPSFLGANPAEVKADYPAGPPRGTRVLGREEELAFELLRTFSPEQLREALTAEQAPRDIRAGGETQPPPADSAGLSYARMDSRQQQLLLALIAVYTGNMTATVAEAEQREIRAAGVENIRFAWAGAREPGVGHYYRVEGPTFVIELCNTQPDAAGNPANHVHTVYRHLKGDFAAANAG
jgi:hypothetical protein